MKKDNDYYVQSAILVPSAIDREIISPDTHIFHLVRHLGNWGFAPTQCRENLLPSQRCWDLVQPQCRGPSPSHPNAVGISSHPDAAGFSSHPNATGISSHPDAAGISSNPNAVGISSNPNAVGISSNPNAAGISSHPNAVGISSHPNAAGISSHPEATGILSHPDAIGISSHPNAVGISSHPNAVGLSSHPNAVGIVNKKVQWSDVPAAVQKTFTENAGGGEIQEIGKESKLIGGRIIPIYEAGLRKTDGSKIEIKVDEDGNLIELGKD